MLWLSSGLLSLVGCDERRAPPPPAELAPAPSPVKTTDPKLTETLSAWINKDWSAFRATRDEKCDAERFAGLPADARTLVLAVHDARFEKKRLLALDLTDALTQPKLHALRDELALAAPGQTPSAALTDEVESLAKRRFVGVFHITEHYGAERVFRMDRSRWEWMPGTLVAWFAVHDAKSGAALCQSLMVVKNDVTSAPIAARLKSDTRERLGRELGRDVRAEARRALARISSELELPEATGNRAVAGRK